MDNSEHGGADVHLPGELTTFTSAGGREAEFAAFYRNSVAKLVRFLMFQGARPADAAEIAQEVMAKVWQSWPALESPLAWAQVTASRALVRRVAALEEDLIDDFAEYSTLLSADSDIDEWIARNHYHQLVTALPPRQRQVMVWTLEGYNPVQIAELLQLNPSTVRSNLRKARRTIITHLEGGEQR